MKQAQPAPRPRGRPPGSKNKPKPPVLPLPKSKKMIPDLPRASIRNRLPLPAQEGEISHKAQGKRAPPAQAQGSQGSTQGSTQGCAPKAVAAPAPKPMATPKPTAAPKTELEPEVQPKVQPEPEVRPRGTQQGTARARPSKRTTRMLERQSAYDRLTAGALGERRLAQEGQRHLDDVSRRLTEAVRHQVPPAALRARRGVERLAYTGVA